METGPNPRCMARTKDSLIALSSLDLLRDKPISSLLQMADYEIVDSLGLCDHNTTETGPNPFRALAMDVWQDNNILGHILDHWQATENV